MRQLALEAAPQLVQAVARQGRHGDRAAGPSVPHKQAGADFRLDPVDLVEDLDEGPFAVHLDAEVGQDFSTSAFWAALSSWLASRTWTIMSASSTSSSVARNAAISSVGKSAMNAHRIGQHGPRSVRQLEAPHRRVEGGEQKILGQDIRGGQFVEQRRLAGIGVTDQCDHRIWHALCAPDAAGRASA